MRTFEPFGPEKLHFHRGTKILFAELIRRGRVTNLKVFALNPTTIVCSGCVYTRAHQFPSVLHGTRAARNLDGTQA